MTRYSDENIPPNYEKVSKSSTKDLYSMLAAWLYKKNITSQSWDWKVCVFLLRKESTKSPQSVILLAFSGKYSWSSVTRAVNLILCHFQMASLDQLWRRSSWWHRNACISFNCTGSSISCYSQPCMKPSYAEHVCACQTAAGLQSITLCHVFQCAIWPQCSFLKKSQDSIKIVPNTSPIASHTLPPFIPPALCVVNSITISTFFPNWEWERSGDLKLKLLYIFW